MKHTLVFLGIMVIMLTACDLAAPALRTEDLVGEWSAGGYVHHFSADGEYRFYHSSGDQKEPAVTGTFTIEGSQVKMGPIYLEARPDLDFCGGASGTYDVKLGRYDTLELTPVDEPCSVRALQLSMFGDTWHRGRPTAQELLEKEMREIGDRMMP